MLEVINNKHSVNSLIVSLGILPQINDLKRMD